MRWTSLTRGGPIAMSLVLVVSVAYADPPTPEPTPDAEGDANMALLAGFQYAIPLGSLGGNAGTWSPAPVATFEVRASERVWWMVRGAATYNTNSYESDGSQNDYQTVDASAATGLRFVTNPGDRLEFSPHVMVGGRFSRFYGDDYEADGWSAAAHAGFNLDAHVTQSFGMRLATDVVGVGYNRSVSSDAAPTIDSRSWFAALTLKPSLEARFRF